MPHSIAVFAEILLQTKPQNFKPNFHGPLENYKQAKPKPRLQQIAKYFQVSPHSLAHPSQYCRPL